MVSGRKVRMCSNSEIIEICNFDISRYFEKSINAHLVWALILNFETPEKERIKNLTKLSEISYKKIFILMPDLIYMYEYKLINVCLLRM